MTAPRRLIEADDEFERELIRSAHADRPQARALERMLLGLGIEISKLPAAMASAAPASASAKIGGLMFAKYLVAGMAIGLATAAGAQVASRTLDRQDSRAEKPNHFVGGAASPGSSPPALPDRLPEPSAASIAPPALPVQTAGAHPRATPVAAALPSVAPEPTAVDSSPARPDKGSFALEALPSPDNLAEEMRLLDAARTALTHGEAAVALANLARYERSFPSGALAPEASVLKVRALLAAGDRTGAEALGRRVIERAPKSQHADAVRAALGVGTNP